MIKKKIVMITILDMIIKLFVRVILALLKISVRKIFVHTYNNFNVNYFNFF